jgi:Fe-S-cluster-containing dehydrogenase component/DMSO reductase anchor subunit
MVPDLLGIIDDGVGSGTLHSSPSHSSRWLVDELLREQQRVTPVEEFAAWHEDALHDAPAKSHVADRTRHYRNLIPVGLPSAGEQFGFEVDLDACSGCKACVTACHNLNDLEPGETWRAVGLLHGGSTQLPALQHVTTACHHCVDPACLKGCPVDAYAKDPTTGIVRHLDDQCIGCQYCTFMCPYDVPKYSSRLGIVRKCDMCRNRLAVSEAPACVQSCPNSAIRIAIVNRQEAIESAEANAFLPGAPEPGCTIPTTIYKTNRAMPRNMLPADYFAAAPQHAHWPLILMLVLTQMAVGTFVAAIVPSRLAFPAAIGSSSPFAHAFAATAIGLLGIAASTLHLGRPLYAFRAVIGWRRSWLSREIIAFGAFAVVAVAYTAAVGIQVFYSDAQTATVNGIASTFGIATCAIGLAGLFCSSMIYAVTQRPFWSFPRTAAKFFLTAAVLGCFATLLVELVVVATHRESLTTERRETFFAWLAITSGANALKLLVDAAILAKTQTRSNTPLKRTALLMLGELGPWTRGRFALGAVATLLPALLSLANLESTAAALASPGNIACLALALVAAFFGEVCERYLYFAAVVAPKMPGAPSA